MSTCVYVPASLRQAGKMVRHAFAMNLEVLPKPQFVAAWSALAYLFPSLHPDEFDGSQSNWPRVLKRFAREAWCRANAGELTDEELYPCDAQWAGVYDRLGSHDALEMERRFRLAADFGHFPDA